MPARVPATSIRPGSRHAVDRHERRIGVWDVDDVFPALEETLDGMNAAQRTFGFELVDTSLPLDVWDNVSSKAKRYLRADKLAERLANKPGSLRVELLVCVTREPMRDDEWLNIFLWWPDEGDPPIMVFSSAGFDVEPQGPDTDRLIVNAIVSGLAGHYGKVHAHNRKPTNCPMYFNAQRELDVLVSAQKFDGKCRAKLRRALGDQLDALEALLEVFA